MIGVDCVDVIGVDCVDVTGVDCVGVTGGGLCRCDWGWIV